jgi:hypothetical protein
VAIPANPHALAVRAKRWGLEAENKHVINVEETEDSVIVTYARHEMEAPEPEAEPEAAPEVEEDRYGYDDEDEDKAETLRSIVRAELLALIGNQNDQPVQDAIDWFEDSQTANRSEDFAALFNEAE